MHRPCFFVSDLHGKIERYHALFCAIAAERPRAIFMGGDLLPPSFGSALGGAEDFIRDVLVAGFRDLWRHFETHDEGTQPRCFIIMGNDDPRLHESSFIRGEVDGLWHYLFDNPGVLGEHPVYGYPFVPPTPFALKDWERYDVSRFVDPGCMAPDEGHLSVEVDDGTRDSRTILHDLEQLNTNLERAILLFHSPPYKSPLDRADLDDAMVDHVPCDVHVGSIAIHRFIEQRQPLVTLHGHVHESVRLTGSWRTRIGRTHCFSAAHDGPELALVRFDPDDLDSARRELL